jgi:hypothetical protein
MRSPVAGMGRRRRGSGVPPSVGREGYPPHMPRISPRVFIPFLVLLLSGCQLSAGDPCDAQSSGFTRTDPCSSQCVDWDVLCADGSTAVPDVCAGSPCTNNPANCANGWGCVQVNATDSVCLPQEICPGGFGVGQPQGLVDPEDLYFPPGELEPDEAPLEDLDEQ